LHKSETKDRSETHGQLWGAETEILFLFLLPPNMQRGRRKKELLFKFCRGLSRLEPTDQPEAPCRWSRTSTVAPNGRPATPCPAPMRNGKKPHSLGSINSTQHSSTERGGKWKKKKKNRGEGDFGGMREGSFETEKGGRV